MRKLHPRATRFKGEPCRAFASQARLMQVEHYVEPADRAKRRQDVPSGRCNRKVAQYSN